jgi:tetratricopeptide (TPR) repeat protein
MNTKSLLVILAATLLFTGHIGAQRKEKLVPPALEERVKGFFADKKAHAQALAKQENQPQVPEIWDFFEAGQNADWRTVADLYRTLRRGAYQYEGTRKDSRLETMVWQPVNEAYGAYEQCANMEEKYVTTFAREILDSVPRGSVYFGGTDPGRWLPTAFSKSHVKADPCFVLTQNALADGLYLKYIRVMYGDRIAVPSDDDSKKAFENYLADAQQRLKDGQLKPGERVTEVDGKAQASGQVAVMQINARLAKRIFDANPEREFFVEESFPLDWMYPHLAPHGLILKLGRKPLSELPADVVRQDRDYWTRFTDRALGQWLMPETPVELVCEFAATVFESKEMGEFKGDRKFVQNAYACKTYSKLRSSIGGAYTWRAKNSASAEEKQRMAKEADFAYRQAFALCPYSPEAVFRYTDLLVEQGRNKEALLLAETAERIDPRNGSFSNLIRELEKKK